MSKLPRHGRSMRTRPIRLTLAGLFVIPLASLLALWGFAAGITLGNVIREQNYHTVDTKVGPAIGPLMMLLSRERAQSYVWLSTNRVSSAAELDATRTSADASVAATRTMLNSIRPLVPADGAGALNALLSKLDQLSGIRSAIDSGQMKPMAAFQAYNDIVDAEFHFFDTEAQVDNALIYQQSIGSIDATRAWEMTGREVTLIGGALAARGQMSPAERALFATTVASQRLAMGDALALLTGEIRTAYVHAYSGATYQQFAAMEDQISGSIGSRGPIPVDPARWLSVSTTFLATVGRVDNLTTGVLAQLSSRNIRTLVTQAVLAGGAGLVAVVASIFLLLRFGRRLTMELTRLHDSAQIIADERLPSIVERLRRGENVDVAAESPPPPPSQIREIAQVAQAFGTVQAAAAEAAVGQARLRQGVNHIFLTLSLRNQSLLHRQLGMLDAMERRTNDPAALDELFRLDHLTTRMRRHAEGLIILSGAIPARGWRDPVPVVDVIRAAIAEVEEYTRVDEVTESRDRVVGSAVNDVVHLIAELIENATSFSPPNTRVEIRADSVAKGFAIDIEDRGLGLTEDELADINRRLAEPSDFDLANSDRLGLYVVGRLAATHGISVTLRRSPYGGTTAIVLMPRSIIVPGGKADARSTPGAADRKWHAGAADRQLTVASPARPAAADQAEPDQLSQDQAKSGSVTAGTHRGLPIRVRQASLAPQLLVRPAAKPGATTGAGSAASAGEEPAPEELRSRMSSLQQGWQRGRVDDLDDPSGPGDWPGRAPSPAPEPSDGEVV